MCLGMCLGYVFGLCVWVPGLDPPRGLVQQISGLTSPWGLFPTLLGPSWDLLFHEAHLNDSSNFSNFSPTKMEKFAPVCSVEQIFLAS
jgi:hypothetical protein